MADQGCYGRLPAEKRDVAILVNPRAGSGPSSEITNQLLRELRRLGLNPRVCRHRAELSALAREEEDRLRCVVAAGGDGTVAEVVNRAPGLPVAILPVGNENLAADYFGFRRSAWRLARAVAVGLTRRVDLARANQRRFVLVASTGIDADVVARVHRRRRGHISRLTWLPPILEALSHYTWPTIEVELLDTGERLRGKQALVFNLPRYALRLPIASEASPEDGLLDLIVLERGGFQPLIEFLMAVLGLRRRLPRGVHRRKLQRLRLESEAQPVPLQIDGDPGFALPAMIEVLPRALELIVPGHSKVLGRRRPQAWEDVAKHPVADGCGSPP